jgi:hypothetical protein
MNNLAMATGTMTKHGLRNITGRNTDFLATVHVLDGAAVHRLVHGFLELTFKAPDKALAINGTLIFAV